MMISVEFKPHYSFDFVQSMTEVARIRKIRCVPHADHDF